MTVLWPEVRVTGNVPAVRLKPVPVTDVELMVRGAAPMLLKVTDWVSLLPNQIAPKETGIGLTLSLAPATFNVRPNVEVTLPAVAVSVTDWTEDTDAALAVNPTLVAFAGTVIVAGTVTAELLLERFTTNPPLAAG